MLTETDLAEIHEQVDREMRFEHLGIKFCLGCKNPTPWDETGKCRVCGRYRDGKPRHPGYVYFFRCEGFVKIGMSYNVDQRLKSIQEANPFPVTKLSAFATWEPFKDEQRLHRALAKHRGLGEWFKTTDEFKTDLRRVCSIKFGKIIEI